VARLPRDCSGAKAVKAFERAGWVTDRRKGSHVTLVKPPSPVVLTVPQHDVLALGTLRALIRNAGLTVDEFVALL
jgi:predicted RNA binding protein YcfA (HicA-like mRNA interferase family)